TDSSNNQSQLVLPKLENRMTIPNNSSNSSSVSTKFQLSEQPREIHNSVNTSVQNSNEYVCSKTNPTSTKHILDEPTDIPQSFPPSCYFPSSFNRPVRTSNFSTQVEYGSTTNRGIPRDERKPGTDCLRMKVTTSSFEKLILVVNRPMAQDELNKLALLLNCTGNKPFELATQLKLDQIRINTIKNFVEQIESYSKATVAMHEVLRCWREQYADKASCIKLFDALIRADEVDVALHLR
ncbi:unnamed protein product, partial [Didymodactylos carnosus]